MIILNDPCNPSGVKYPLDLIHDLEKILLKPEFQHIMLVCDETYHELVFGENHVMLILYFPTNKFKKFFLEVVDESFKQRTFIISCLSKCIAGMPGIRVGFLFSPEYICDDGEVISYGTGIIFTSHLFS